MLASVPFPAPYDAARPETGCCGRESAVVGLPPYELPGLEPQRRRQPFEIVDREVSQTTLDAADVGAIDLAEIGKRLLTEFLLGPDPPEIRGEDLPKSAWMGPFHARIGRERRR